MGERQLCFGIGLLMSQPSRFEPRQVFQVGTRSSDTRDPNGISNQRSFDLLATVGKLLAMQDGGVLREGIRALSEALMEMEV